MDSDGDSLGGQRPCDRLTEPDAAASHQRAFAIQLEVYDGLPERYDYELLFDSRARNSLSGEPHEKSSSRGESDTAGENDYALSPNGKRAVSTARRPVLLPVEHGATRNLTSTGYVDEDHPTWSPDGRTIAYTTDISGEQQIAIRAAEGGPEKILTRFATRIFYTPVWSPGGDGRFGVTCQRLHAAILAQREVSVFLSTRHENPIFSESEFNIATLDMTAIYVATLSKAAASPFALQSDEGAVEPHDKAESDEAWAPGAVKPITTNLAGLAERIVPLPIPDADVATFDVRGDKVYYKTAPPQTLSGPRAGQKSALHMYDMNARKDAVVVDDLDSYSLSADGPNVFYKKDRS